MYQQHGYPHETRVQGLFARALQKQYPLMPIEEEGRLHDAKLFENAGADMLELHISSAHRPSASAVGQKIELVKKIFLSLKEAVKIPISAKLSIVWTPFEPHVKAAVDAGIVFRICFLSGPGMLIDVDS